MTAAAHIPSDAGFTLIELMVALALLGLLSLVLLTSTRFGILVWSRSDAALRSAGELRNAEAVMSRAVAQTYPKLLSTGTADSHVDFEGATHSLVFLTPDNAIPGALARTKISIEHIAGRTELVRSETPELGGPERASVLLHNVRLFAVSYFGAINDKTQPNWCPGWRDKTRLPLLIRFDIALADAPPAAFVTAPRLSADVGCVFDPLTKTCRGR